MVEQTAITIAGDASLFISPAVDVQSAMVRYQAMKEFIDGVLRNEVDYGIIPGTNKPTLLKPGAEKLATFFGLAPQFEIVEKELDWTGKDHGGEAFFYFHYRCRLMRRGQLAAEGEGSASSFEKKYRWRLSEVVCPECGKAAIKKSKFPPRNNPKAAPGWYCYGKAGGCGVEFAADDKRITEQERGQVKNPDIADVVNTLQKMAQKRAYVAAVLLAVNGSEYFTQDVEDFIDGNYTIESAPAARATIPEPPPDVIPPDDFPAVERPAPAKVYSGNPKVEGKLPAEQPKADAPKNGNGKAAPEAPASTDAPLTYAAPVATFGAHKYPMQWTRLLVAYTRADKETVDGILQMLRLPQDTRPEQVIDAVNGYLDKPTANE